MWNFTRFGENKAWRQIVSESDATGAMINVRILGQVFLKIRIIYIVIVRKIWTVYELRKNIMWKTVKLFVWSTNLAPGSLQPIHKAEQEVDPPLERVWSDPRWGPCPASWPASTWSRARVRCDSGPIRKLRFSRVEFPCPISYFVFCATSLMMTSQKRLTILQLCKLY